VESRNGKDLSDRLEILKVDYHHCVLGGAKEEVDVIDNMIKGDSFPEVTEFACPFCNSKFDDEEAYLGHLEFEHKESKENIEEKSIYWKFGRFCTDFCLINGQVIDFENNLMNKWRCRWSKYNANFETKERRDLHEKERS
jgi:hypothetical protein